MSAFNKLITSMEDTKEIDQAIEVMEAEDSSDPEDIEKVEDYKEELEKLKQQEQQEEGADSVEEGATEEDSDTESTDEESTGEDEATGEESEEETPEAAEGSEEPTEESKETKESEGEENGEVQENQEGSKKGNGKEEVTSTESLSLSKEEIMIKEGEENLEPIDDLKEKLEEAKECGSMESITAFDLRKARNAIKTLGFSIESLNMVALSTESENQAENLNAAIAGLKEISTKIQHGIKMAKDKLVSSETK